MGRPCINLENQTFGRLTAIKRVGSRGKHALWECVCSCGNVKNISAKHLKTKATSSCGCLKSELSISNNIIHGFTKSKQKQISEYNAWKSIKERCLKPYNPYYYRYGGRGIKICDRWLTSFDNFIKDMGFKPTPKHTIDRINNNGDYSPSNCRWATYREQNSNRSNNVWVDFRGKNMILADWSRLIGITSGNLSLQIKKRKSLKNVIEHYEKKRNCIIL